MLQILVKSRFHRLLSVTLLVTAFLCGCSSGENGPAKYRVYGKVTYDGKPLESGEVIFMPDNAKGTTGPIGKAAISGGKFDTRLKGNIPPIAGHLIVEVTGNAPPDPKAEVAVHLFDTYRMEIQMPEKEQVLDIDVPLKKKGT